MATRSWHCSKPDSAPTCLTRINRPARIVPLSHAARLSEVTLHDGSTSGAAAIIRAGIQTGTRCAARCRSMHSTESAGCNRSSHQMSACPYCSIASNDMRCAARSSKPMPRCAVRTASAKGPPPGTITTRPAHDASARTQSVNIYDKAKLPPSLTTTGAVAGNISRQVLDRSTSRQDKADALWQSPWTAGARSGRRPRPAPHRASRHERSHY